MWKILHQQTCDSETRAGKKLHKAASPASIDAREDALREAHHAVDSTPSTSPSPIGPKFQHLCKKTSSPQSEHMSESHGSMGSVYLFESGG